MYVLKFPSTQSVLSVRFEVGVSLLLAPARADKRGPKVPFPLRLVENSGIAARDSPESTHRSSGESRVLLKALVVNFRNFKRTLETVCQKFCETHYNKYLGQDMY